MHIKGNGIQWNGFYHKIKLLDHVMHVLAKDIQKRVEKCQSMICSLVFGEEKGLVDGLW
jgi:hypothetical protein